MIKFKALKILAVVAILMMALANAAFANSNDRQTITCWIANRTNRTVKLSRLVHGTNLNTGKDTDYWFPIMRPPIKPNTTIQEELQDLSPYFSLKGEFEDGSYVTWERINRDLLDGKIIILEPEGKYVIGRIQDGEIIIPGRGAVGRLY